jgi:hypothetical protein
MERDRKQNQECESTEACLVSFSLQGMAGEGCGRENEAVITRRRLSYASVRVGSFLLSILFLSL